MQSIKSFLVLALTSFAALMPVMSTAEENQSFDVVLGSGAMICDKAESVVVAFQTSTKPDDCGIFRTRTGAPVTVTIIGHYEDKPLVRFEFQTPTPWGNDTQYGWWAGEIPDAIPQGTSL